MKRRREDFDYLDRGIYMITMVVEGRRPLLGTLAGDADATEGPEAPHVVLSPLGERIREEWTKVSRHYHQIEMMKLCIMPDHIHGLIYVHERIERHLGHVLNGFKAGTRKAARELGIIAEVKPQPTTTTAPPSAHPSLSASLYTEALTQSQSQSPSAAAAVAAASVQSAAAAPSAVAAPAAAASQRPRSLKHPPVGTLWEPGYNDRLLLHKGQLERMKAYLDDNPRRLLLKRQYPQFLSHLTSVTLNGVTMEALGNVALLQSASRLQVQCSRHLYPWEVQQQKAQVLAAGQRGAVVVSPCISPGEVEITTACMEAGIPLIVLLLKGFPPFFKPKPRYLTACAAGRLLLLSPFPWQNERITNMRQRCLYLNEVAAMICR